MKRLILVPQYPTKMRYQEWWITEFTKHLKEAFSEIIVLGKEVLNKAKIANSGDFAPIMTSIDFELGQVKEYMQMIIYEDDILLLMDLSFPGFFAQVLHHKAPKKCFAICHATSKNNYDYFYKTKSTKWPIEKASAELFEKVFVATEYHKRLLGWENVHVMGLPDPPFIEIRSEDKFYPISTASRNTRQKRNVYLESDLSIELGIDIHEIKVSSWSAYYMALAKTKVLLITAKEETYGYQVVDALRSGCFVVAPNKFSYPELLPRLFLYETYEELKKIMFKLLDVNRFTVPVNLMQEQVDNFYINLIKEINE